MNSDSVFRDRARQHVGMDRLMSTRMWASSFDSQGVSDTKAAWRAQGGGFLVFFLI